MKITRSIRTIFIEADSSEEFDRLVNDSMKGLVDPTLQIYGLFKGAITYKEIVVEEDEKTIADLFEEAGCGAKCGECPFFNKPTDGRVKYVVCGKRRVSEKSRACDDYYLGRRANVSAFRTETEGTGLERRGSRRMSEGIASGSLQQETRTNESLTA